MSKLLLAFAILLLFGACASHGYVVPFNVTVNYPFTWTTDSFTKVMYTFLSDNTSGVAVYQDLSDSSDFNNYAVPSGLKDYSLFGVFQIDMQKVVIPSENSQFSFKHDFSFGILNVNPKEVCIIGIDLEKKEFKQIDFSYGTFYNEIILPLQRSVYTLGIMAIEKEIPGQFGVPALVNYRASLKYEVHKDLNQYLSCFVNRPLVYPSHEYTATRVNNQQALLSNDMVEIISFSFTPMFAASYSGRMVVHDFEMTFDNALGFVDKDGAKVEIDSSSLQCLYIVKGKTGLTQVRGSSVVFPGWQKLACTPEVGVHDFYPEYVTIVANLKSKKPQQSTNPINPTNNSKQPRGNSIPNSESVDLRMVHYMIHLILIVCVVLIIN